MKPVIYSCSPTTAIHTSKMTFCWQRPTSRCCQIGANLLNKNLMGLSQLRSRRKWSNYFTCSQPCNDGILQRFLAYNFGISQILRKRSIATFLLRSRDAAYLPQKAASPTIFLPCHHFCEVTCLLWTSTCHSFPELNDFPILVALTCHSGSVQ